MRKRFSCIDSTLFITDTSIERAVKRIDDMYIDTNELLKAVEVYFLNCIGTQPPRILKVPALISLADQSDITGF
jgi:hypothetical protein